MVTRFKHTRFLPAIKARGDPDRDLLLLLSYLILSQSLFGGFCRLKANTYKELHHVIRSIGQQHRNPMHLPVAFPDKISGSCFPSILSTAATRSGRFSRHRRRSHRSRIPSYPRIVSLRLFRSAYFIMPRFSCQSGRPGLLAETGTFCIQNVRRIAPFVLDIRD